MKITYFRDTDTLYIEFRSSEVAETRELDENTLLDIDARGNLCGLISRDQPPPHAPDALSALDQRRQISSWNVALRITTFPCRGGMMIWPTFVAGHGARSCRVYH
jgi:hypothetical protein